MSTRSQQDLINEILENLGVLGAAQTANVEDTTRVEELLPSIGPYLAAKQIVYVPDFNNIPQEAFIPLAHVAAFVCHGKFGITGDELTTIKANNDMGVADLKIIYRGRYTGAPLKTEYC